nr:unnamed protein product [Callosobruchus chinensis]
MPHVDIRVLFNQIQKVTIDALKIQNNIGDFERAISKIRSEIVNKDTQLVDQNDSELTAHHRRGEEQLIGANEEDRLLKCAILFCRKFKQFPLYEKEFPEDFLKEAIKFYPCLNGSRLQTELLYPREEFRQISDTSAVGLLGLLQDGLRDSFHEIIKLLKIIITIPMATSEAERQFYRLKRIKTFLRNTMKEKRLNALTLLSCKKEFIN